MCEQLGTEPLDEEIPTDLSDFPEEMQVAFELYFKIPDRWEYMSGSYIGKDLSVYKTIAEILGIDDLRVNLELLLLIDHVRKDILMEKQKQLKDAK